MTGHDAVLDRASMQRKPKMRTAIIECKHLSIIIDDAQWAASTARDNLTRGLQLLKRRHANEVSSVFDRAFLGP
jgi:hypothetical protein